jgi:hypothetical protein
MVSRILGLLKYIEPTWLDVSLSGDLGRNVHWEAPMFVMHSWN